MTIERTRELLGDKVKDMTDQEVQELIQRYSRLADVVVEVLPRYLKRVNNKVSTQKLYT